MEEMVNAVIGDLHAGRQPSTELLSLTGRSFADKVRESYETITPDFKTPDTEMLARLTSDVWQFSAAKNWQEMRDLTLLLKDDDGKLRTFADFKDQAVKITGKYNEAWFRSEYNFSVAASQNAARWTEFERDKDTIPNLKYQTVGDDAVRPEHQLLDGIIRPVSDPFWSTHYPPNGYGCRCEAVQSPTGLGTVTPDDKVPLVDIPKMFRTNLAKTGLIFPKNHPYYNGIPKPELRKSIAWLQPEDTYQSFVIGDYELDIHPLHGDKELGKNLEAVNALMRHDPKAKVKLLPVIEVNTRTKAKDMAARDKFFPEDYMKKFPGRNADAIYNNKVVEFESPNGSKRSIQHAISHGKAQAGKVIIHIGDRTDFGLALNAAKGHIKAHYKDGDFEVWLLSGKRFVKVK
ncbi:phage minor head protein [Proteiniphilum sp.]|uniref:phage minor head protein n=1 Tax=Proteiniphilum sp. TaxID=1926877 RepID=UPI002B1F831D|nr:phage minor head protein [Proteiniphilum sp.]MEA4916556.1 phage minor head protein [Proteiniphilum sp.]